MQYSKKITAYVREDIVDSRIVCDSCGKDIKRDGCYDGNEVTIEAHLGSMYPESDDRTTHEVDICPSCFMTKIVPAFAAVGISFRVRDTDRRPIVMDPNETF